MLFDLVLKEINTQDFYKLVNSIELICKSDYLEYILHDPFEVRENLWNLSF